MRRKTMVTKKSKKTKKAKMRLGRVVIDLGYVVDLDNPEMIKLAKERFYDDLMSAQKYDEMESWMQEIEDPSATEEQIPDHLLPDFEV